jgi:hypothetical protein
LVGCGYFPGAAENHVLVGCAWHLMGMVRRAEMCAFGVKRTCSVMTLRPLLTQSRQRQG